jgi:3-hydroxyisobutyrate dehydrogenase
MVQGIGVAGNMRIASAWIRLWNEEGIRARAFDPRGIAASASGGTATQDADSFRNGLNTLFVCTDDLLECENLLIDGPAFARTAPDLDTIVIAATLPPRFVKALRGRIRPQITLIDAPWSGTMRMAQRGALTMLLGGPSDAVIALTPLLAPLTAATERMGAFGSAMAAKVMKDFLAASSTAMTRLALDWAQAQGIEERRLLNVIEAARGSIASGADLPDHNPQIMPQLSEGVMAALVKEVECAFDAALTGASLTPPGALRHVVTAARGRSLH